jgi:hypothetical protein
VDAARRLRAGGHEILAIRLARDLKSGLIRPCGRD